MASPAPSVSELSDVSFSELSTDEFLKKVSQIKDLETLDELKLDLLEKSQVIATKVCAVVERIEKLNPTSSVDGGKIVSVIVVVGENEHNTDVSKDWTVKQFREHLAKSFVADFPTMKDTEKMKYVLDDEKFLNESGRRSLGKWNIKNGSIIKVSKLSVEDKEHLKSLKKQGKTETQSQSSEQTHVQALMTLAGGYQK